MRMLQELSQGALPRGWKLKLGAAWLVASIGLAYLCYKLAVEEVGFDFRYIWVAGKLWSAGKSPYGPDFIFTFDELIHALRPISHFWVYPPYWLPIAVPLGVLPFAFAAKLWGALNIGFVVSAAWLFSRSRGIALAFVLAGLTLVDASVLAIWYGQTSLIVLIGSSLLLWSTEAKHKTAAATAALVLLALKPNVGVFFFIFMMLRRRFGVVIGAACALVLLCIPTILLFDFREFTAFFHALSQYNAPQTEANLPANMTGAVNLLSLAMPDSAARLISLIAMLGSTVALGLAARAGSESTRLMGMIVATLVFVPLHDYDLSLLVLPLLWVGSKDRRLTIPACVLFGILVRPGWIVSITGLRHPNAGIFHTSLLVSLVILATAVCWLYYLRSPQKDDDFAADVVRSEEAATQPA